MQHIRLPQIFHNIFSNRSFCMFANKMNFGIEKHPVYKTLSLSRNISFLACCKNNVKWFKWKSFKKMDLHQTNSYTQNVRQISRPTSGFSQSQPPAQTEEQKIKNRTILYYCVGFVTFIGGLSYLSVILYRLYCQATGKGGRAVVEEAGEKVAKMLINKTRNIAVKFNADTNSMMMWNFKPSQSLINVSPGETALAFYTAKNPTDKPITGVATYNILPYEAGVYFNKIQCFCFEEQQLNPHEEVDMPVFFYLDPEYSEDPRLENINEIILSYTFYEAKDGFKMPFPTFKQ